MEKKKIFMQQWCAHTILWIGFIEMRRSHSSFSQGTNTHTRCSQSFLISKRSGICIFLSIRIEFPATTTTPTSWTWQINKRRTSRRIKKMHPPKIADNLMQCAASWVVLSQLVSMNDSRPSVAPTFLLLQRYHRISLWKYTCDSLASRALRFANFEDWSSSGSSLGSRDGNRKIST